MLAYYCVAERWDAVGGVPYADVQAFLDMCEECFGVVPDLVQRGEDWYARETGEMILEARLVDEDDI